MCEMRTFAHFDVTFLLLLKHFVTFLMYDIAVCKCNIYKKLN